MGRTRRRSQGGAGPKNLPSKAAAKAGKFNKRPPSTLSKEGKEWWVWAVGSMDAMGILDKADWYHVKLTAEAVEDYHRRRAQLALEGDTISTMDGVKRNPIAGLVQQDRVAIKSLHSDLGLTPSARAKFGGNTEEGEKDPFEEIMNKNRRN